MGGINSSESPVDADTRVNRRDFIFKSGEVLVALAAIGAALSSLLKQGDPIKLVRAEPVEIDPSKPNRIAEVAAELQRVGITVYWNPAMEGNEHRVLISACPHPDPQGNIDGVKAVDALSDLVRLFHAGARVVALEGVNTEKGIVHVGAVRTSHGIEIRPNATADDPSITSEELLAAVRAHPQILEQIARNTKGQYNRVFGGILERLVRDNAPNGKLPCVVGAEMPGRQVKKIVLDETRRLIQARDFSWLQKSDTKWFPKLRNTNIWRSLIGTTDYRSADKLYECLSRASDDQLWQLNEAVLSLDIDHWFHRVREQFALDRGADAVAFAGNHVEPFISASYKDAQPGLVIPPRMMVSKGEIQRMSYSE